MYEPCPPDDPELVEFYRQTPLDPATEARLHERARAGDSEASRRLIAAHHHGLVAESRRQRTTRTGLDDLYRTAVLAFLEAIQQLPPDETRRLWPRVRPYVHGACWRLARGSDYRGQIEDESERLQFKRTLRRVEHELGREPDDDEIADSLGWSVAAVNVVWALDVTLSDPLQLDQPLADGESTTLGATLASDLRPADELLIDVEEFLEEQHNQDQHVEAVVTLAAHLSTVLSFEDKLLLRDFRPAMRYDLMLTSPFLQNLSDQSGVRVRDLAQEYVRQNGVGSLEDLAARWGVTKQAIEQRRSRIEEKTRAVVVSLGVDESTYLSGLERMRSDFEREIEREVRDADAADAASRPLSPEELEQFWNEPVPSKRRPRAALRHD